MFSKQNASVHIFGSRKANIVVLINILEQNYLWTTIFYLGLHVFIIGIHGNYVFIFTTFIFRNSGFYFNFIRISCRWLLFHIEIMANDEIYCYSFFGRGKFTRVRKRSLVVIARGFLTHMKSAMVVEDEFFCIELFCHKNEKRRN